MYFRSCLAILCLCLFTVAQSGEPDLRAPETSAIPTLLTNADNAYKKDGPQAFLAALLDNAIPDDTASKASLLQQAQAVSDLLRQIEMIYGSFEGVELIESIPVADSTRIVYYVLNYETGPAYGALTVYRAEEGELVTGFAVNTELHKVVPPDLIINRAQTQQLRQ